eukprot:scaffold25.g5104.t1
MFVASLVVPMLLAVAGAAALVFRRPGKGETVFEDKSTGVAFEAPAGSQPARDNKGELAFTPVGNTPWPVEEGAQGERLRINVGPVGATQHRTFVFNRRLPGPSRLLAVTLDRPLGIVFEEDPASGRAAVAELTPGGNAEAAWRRARLNPALAASVAAPGDVLRACTCTTITYQTAALLFGAQKPTRTIGVFGADAQRWPEVATALRKGLVADGPVTLVLERPAPAGQQPGVGGVGGAAGAAAAGPAPGAAGGEPPQG